MKNTLFAALMSLISFSSIAQENTIADTLNSNSIIFYTQNGEDISTRLYGTMNYEGEVVIKPVYQHLSRANNAMMVACKGEWKVYNDKKVIKKVLKGYGVSGNSNYQIMYDLKGKYGVISDTDKEIEPFVYSYIHGGARWLNGNGKNKNVVRASKINDGAIYYYSDGDGGSGSKHASNYGQQKGKLELELKLQ